MPFGSVSYFNGEPEGSPTGPTERTLTYEPTDKTDGAVATAKYVLGIHDEVEDLTKWDENYDTAGPYHGTGQGDHPAIVDGFTPAGDSTGQIDVAVTKVRGWSFGIGVDIDLTKWLRIFGINISRGYEESEELTVTRRATLGSDVPDG